MAAASWRVAIVLVAAAVWLFATVGAHWDECAKDRDCNEGSKYEKGYGECKTDSRSPSGGYCSYDTCFEPGHTLTDGDQCCQIGPLPGQSARARLRTRRAAKLLADEAAGIPCPNGLTACGNQCIDLSDDIVNCGQCGNSCDTSIPHATFGNTVCTLGRCQVYSCEAGFTVSTLHDACLASSAVVVQI